MEQNKEKALKEMSEQELLDYTKSLIKENQELHKITKNKYGILFERKTEKVEEEMQLKYPILVEDNSKKIFKGEKQTNNILIEGDNLHALTVLQYTHKNKIDVIYIDPPYNTGNKDFIYNDRFVDKEDVFHHSKWLSFMEKRLMLARELLRDSGVIFISIDDNEFAQLKLLCDGIFGEENFVNCAIWNKKRTQGRGSVGMIDWHEYVLVYTKKNLNKKLFYIDKSDKQKTGYKYIDEIGKYRLLPFEKTGNAEQDRPHCKYPLYYENQTILPRKQWWRWGKETYEKNKDLIVFRKNKNNEIIPFTKDYINKNGEEIKTTPPSIIEGIYNSEGTEELKNIFGEILFSNPKPVKLIKYLIQIISNKNSVILDFFAGSGTTGHAVIGLNKEDNGHRQFILCTNNEGNICTNVCYPRIQKVMNGYVNAEEEEIEGLSGNLSYFKTEFIDKDFSKLARETVLRDIANKCKDILKIKENAFEDFISDNPDFYSIVLGKDKIVGIYFNSLLTKEEELKKILLKSNKKEKILYCFTYGSKLEETIKKEWNDIGIEAVAIPKEIMDIYDNAINSIKRNTVPDEDLKLMGEIQTDESLVSEEVKEASNKTIKEIEDAIEKDPEAKKKKSMVK